MNNQVPIVLAFTSNYFVPAVTCISSILENSEKKYQFHFIILLNEDLDQRLKDKLEKFVANRGVFTYLNLSDQLKGVYIDERYTIAASFRLLLPRILPDYKKVIYIDCDIIVRNDIAKLFNELDLLDNYLAAVDEPTLINQLDYILKLGCVPGKYFNSGFLIMNLEELRKDKMVDKFIEGLKVPYLQFPDQDVLNKYCQKRVIKISPIYNSIRIFFLVQYKLDFLKRYSLKDWDDIQEYGNVHYTGAKPWNNFTVKFNLWWEYYNKLPEYIKDEWEVNKRMLRLNKIYSIRFVEIVIDRILNVYRKVKY